MNNHKGALAAGALTGLVIITLLVMGLGNIKAVAGKGSAVPQELVPIPQTTDVNGAEAVQAWQQYSADLEQAVQTMQDRENSYQAQIDLANQTILQLQDEINTANSSTKGGPAFSYEEDEHEEHEGYEHDDD